MAMPRVPSEFRGWVIIDGKYAPDGTVITVLDKTGIVCGSATVKEGLYGPLSCQGDDPLTSEDEGAELNEPLTFLVGARELNTDNAIKWQPGQAREVNLVQGEVEDAEYFFKNQPDPWDQNFMIILSLLVIASLWIITAAVLALLRFISNKKKKVRWLQVE